MSISKIEKDGKIFYEVFVKIRDSAGKQKAVRRRGFTSEREAKRIEFELLNSLQGFKNKTTWKNWVSHFLERYRVICSNSTFANYKHNLSKWVTPTWENSFIDEITTSDIHHIVFEHMTNVSSLTRKTILQNIKRVFSMAVEEGVLVRNPAVGVKIRTPEANQKVLNAKEIEIFLREAKSVNHRFYPQWALALLTGMRNGELLALQWSDVDFSSGFISINKAWTRFGGLGPTKTAKNRVCPISDQCRKFLTELKLQTGSTEFVLPRSWEWNQGQQAYITKDFCKGIGITPIKFHDLRATFITQMLINGVPLAKVMAIVGHSSLKTTQGYLRLCGKDVEGATESLQIQLPDLASEGKVYELFSARR